MKTIINSTALCFGVMLLVAIALVQCTFGAKSNSDTIETSFTRGKGLDPNEWQCYDLEKERVCVPIKWNFFKQNVCLFFAQIDDDVNTYFGIIKDSRLSADQYLKEVYDQMRIDTSEVFTGYTLKKLTFKDKVTYYGEYFATIGGIDYFAYSMVFEHEGSVYDIGLKLKAKDSPEYKDVFKDILFNLKIDDVLVFSEKDEILSIDAVKLSD